ncbi:MAG: hypothetical protein R3E45_10645 [Rhodocyclaceae bacterium]
MRFSPCYRTLAPRGRGLAVARICQRTIQAGGRASSVAHRNDAYHHFALHLETHAFMAPAGLGVVPQDVPEGRLGAQQLAPHELEHQAPREAAILEIRIGTHPADLGRAPVNSRSPAIASKRGPSRSPKYSPSSMLRMPSGPGRLRVASSSARAAWAQPGRSASQASSSSGIGAFHIILNIVVSASIRQPAGAAPDQPAQYSCSPGLKKDAMGAAARPLAVDEAKQWRKPGRIAPHLAGAAYDWRSPARQGTPDDVVLILADLHFDSPPETTAPGDCYAAAAATSM